MAPGGAVIRKTGAFYHRPEVVKRDPSVDDRERTLDDVFELGCVQHARTAQSKEMSPGFRGKTPALVRAHHAECHFEIRSRCLRQKGSRWIRILSSHRRRDTGGRPNLFRPIYSSKDYHFVDNALQIKHFGIDDRMRLSVILFTLHLEPDQRP